MIDNPRRLPGFLKKSFQLPFRGGYIWFEHLDGIYDNNDLVIEKLKNDTPIFCRPSISSLFCVNFDETHITDEIVAAFTDAIITTDKIFKKICFVGVDRHNSHKFKKNLSDRGIELKFINDFQKAKEWLIP